MSKETYSIEAIFHKLNTDSEGESMIQFKVPLKHLPKALAISTLLNKVLKLQINVKLTHEEQAKAGE